MTEIMKCGLAWKIFLFMDNKLKEKIKRLKYAYELTVGKFDKHSEDNFIVLRISKEDAIALSKEFGQYSIFYNDTENLEYIKCKDNSVLVYTNI